MEEVHAIVANNPVLESTTYIGFLKEAGDVNSRGIVSANNGVI